MPNESCTGCSGVLGSAAGWPTIWWCCPDEYWIDVAFEARRLAVEVDGWAWHCDVDRFAHDRRRQNALVLAGWTVLRFTWHDLMSRPKEVVAEIRAALRRAGDGR